jgi:hypothetical protein
MGDHTNCGGDYEEVPCGCWCAAEAAK